MNYAFIHIPKNAGMSMEKAIKSLNSDTIKFFHHGCLFKNLINYKEIIILRDPIDRFTSAFFYLKNYPKNVNSSFSTPDQLIDGFINFDPEASNFVKVQKHNHSVNGNIINTDWVFHKQSSWIHKPNIVMIYENLDSEIDNLNAILKINLTLPKINSRKRLPFKYSSKHIDFIKLYYAEDFENYSIYSRKQI